MGAKWSTLYTEIPAGIATGKLELRAECHVSRIEHDAGGRASGVVYFDRDGRERRQRARVVCVAGNALETPRLLLLSASSKFRHGLANSSGQVGRNYMRHPTGAVFARFDEAAHMYRGTTMASVVTDESHHDPARGFAGGYESETISLGLPVIANFLDPGAWGSAVTSMIDAYTHLAGLWIVGEDMPQTGNRVTLDDTGKDQWGLPVAHVHYDDHPNDLAMRRHGYRQGRALYEAVGARQVVLAPPFPSSHNLGTCRMSARPEDGVVNRHGRAHEVPKLFVSDGSQFTTSAAVNPTLTIVALAIRQAEHIVRGMAAREL